MSSKNIADLKTVYHELVKCSDFNGFAIRNYQTNRLNSGYYAIDKNGKIYGLDYINFDLVCFKNI